MRGLFIFVSTCDVVEGTIGIEQAPIADTLTLAGGWQKT
jgi:hypothetical protein